MVKFPIVLDLNYENKKKIKLESIPLKYKKLR